MNTIDFERVKQHVLIRLERFLSPFLFYHSIQHTRDDVLPGVERLAKMGGVDAENILLLRTAAVYHDVGYLEVYQGHETVSADIARAELGTYGYTPAQIQKIVALIMVTQMPQTPQNDLEKIICDADLDALGREDFFISSHYLFAETKIMGTEVSVKEWYVQQLKFLDSHAYFTPWAQSLRNAGKQKNIQALQALLKP